MRIPLFQVDAFANRPFRGNPAAVCPLSVWLDDQTMRKVAAEKNVSATAFFVPGKDAYEIRWFTPVCEVRLCGHATLASAFVLLTILQPELPEVRFATRSAGVLRVWRDGALFSMDWPAIPTKTCDEPPPRLIRALPASRPVDILEANSTYFAVYESEATVQSFRPDFALLEQLHPYALAITAPGGTADFVSRYFAPTYGVPEDPATGSAQCVLVPYWSKRLNKEHLQARQLSERGGDFYCEMAGDRVIINGRAVLTMQATLSL